MSDVAEPAESDEVGLAALANPYDFAKPVTREDRFAGRTSELADVKYYLDLAKQTPEPMNLAVIGERASGKTSMLNIIDIEAKKIDLITARINLNTGDAEPINFFWKLYDALVNSYCAAGYLFETGSDEEQIYRRIIDSLDPSADSANFPLRFPSQYARSIIGSRQISESKLQHDLEYIYSETRAPSLLLFDECNILTQNRVTLEILRNVFMNIPGYMLALTGTPTFFPLLDEVFSPIIRQFKKIYIQPFVKLDDTRACVFNPLRSVSLSPDALVPRPALYDIHATSGGRPYEIQLLCHFMFRRMQDQRATQMSVTADVMDDVLNELEANISGSAARPIVAVTRNMNRAQLAAVGVFGRSNGSANFDLAWLMNVIAAESARLAGDVPAIADELTHAELLGLLDELQSLGVLEVQSDGKVYFAGDEFDRIYLRYHAERLGLSVAIDDDPMELALPTLLDKALGQVGVRTQIEYPRDPSLEKSVSALLFPPRGQVSETALDAIEPVFTAIESGRLAVAGVTISYGDVRARSWAWWPSDDAYSLEADPRFNELRNAIESNGAAVAVTSLTFDLPPEDQILAPVRASSNVRLKQRFMRFFSGAAFSDYAADELPSALANAKRAASFDVVNGDILNNAGYIHVAAGYLDESEEFLRRAVSASLDVGDYRTASLALYNSAMIAAVRLEFNDAKDILAESRETLTRSNEGIFPLEVLFVPARLEGDGTLTLKEMETPELSASIDTAEAVLSSRDSYSAVRVNRLSQAGRQ